MRILKLSAIVFVLIGSFFLVTNLWVVTQGQSRTLSSDPIEPRDYAIVLGAGVRGFKLSGALRGRMLKAIELYNSRIVARILVTGDGTDVYYNETLAMQKFAISNDVPAHVVMTDPQGYSTYTSVTRAKTQFRIESAYIISQDFHLSRAVWLANAAGIDAWGVPTNVTNKDKYYFFREMPARTKDFTLFVLGQIF